MLDGDWSSDVCSSDLPEFGRTVRENGTGGSDHGTGGLAILAGGSIRGGRMLGRWPGISDEQLLEGRDLMPTADLREVAAAALHRQFGIAASTLNGAIFPGLDFTPNSTFLV
jgi:uncharacterized protein (DUF1501 family)